MQEGFPTAGDCEVPSVVATGVKVAFERRETQRVLDFVGFRLTQPNLQLYGVSVMPCGFMELRGALAELDMTPLEWLSKQVWIHGLLPQSLINWIDFGRLSLEGLRRTSLSKGNRVCTFIPRINDRQELD